MGYFCILEFLFMTDEPMESYNESSTESESTAYPFNWLQTTYRPSIQNETSETSLPWWKTTPEEEIWMNDTTTESTRQAREDTELEVVLNMICTAVFVIAIFTGNILLLTVMWKLNLLQPCNRLLRTFIAVTDMILAISAGNLITSTSVLKYLYLNWFCLINTKVTSFCLGVLLNLSAILAVERYIFIVHPMRYLVWVTKSKVVLSFIGILSLLITYFIVNSSMINGDLVHYLHASFVCGTGKAIVYFFLFIFPGMVIICIAVIKLVIFVRRFAPNSAEAIDAKKAIKLILLLSGALFITYIPSYVIRMAILQVWTWDELDSGVNIPAFIAVRCTSFILSFMSSASNPIIQFYVEKDLWVGLRKIMGWKAYFANQVDMLEAANARN